MLVFEKPGLNPLLCVNIRLLHSLGNELSSRCLEWWVENSEIIAISNLYKDTLDDFIDNSALGKYFLWI